jgi:cell division septum initiation protein DivIVA
LNQLEGKKSQKSQKEARLQRSTQARTELKDAEKMNHRKRKRLESIVSSDTNELEVQIELLEKDITRIEEEIATLTHTRDGIFS